MPRLHVIYLPEPHIEQRHVIEAIGTRHDLVVFDRDAPLEMQFQDADVVIDSGGSVGTRAMLDAALRVRLLHLDKRTRGIVDDRRLRRLKPSAFLINVARGPLVDEPALTAALQEGRLAGAGIDVFSSEPPEPDSPLLRLPNVVATPHTAGNSDRTLRRRAIFCAENVDRVAAGLEPDCRIA